MEDAFHDCYQSNIYDHMDGNNKISRRRGLVFGDRVVTAKGILDTLGCYQDARTELSKMWC